MTDRIHTALGTWILLFVSVFNLAALVCLAVYQLRFQTDIETISVRHSKAIFKDIINELKPDFSGRRKRSVQDSRITDPELKQIIQELTNLQKSLSTTCHTSCRNEAVDVLKEAVTYMRPSESQVRRQLSTNGTFGGNELAQIFNEIANSEIDIINKYCSNNSMLCLPGAKGSVGSKGDPGINGAAGIPGLKGDKGDQGIMGLPGKKGEIGIAAPGSAGAKGSVGSKGDPGITGAAGPPGQKGDKGDQGIMGLPGKKGDIGIAAPGLPGHKGDIGQPGIKGDKGDLGLQGVAGSPGYQGVKGQKGDPSPLGVPLKPATTCCQSLAIPQFSQQVEQIQVTEGTDVTLRCDPHGFPPPQLSWNPNPSNLDLFRTIVGVHNLTIQNTNVADSKMYTCVAQNALGDSEKQFVVQVYQHIKFEETPQNHTVMMGNSVVMECKIEGPLNPTVSWYKVMPDGSRLQLTTGITQITNGSQLHIDHVSRGDEGEYICEGHNGVEKINKTAYLAAYGPPHITPPGTVTAVKGDQVRLKCDVDAHPPATVTWTYPPGVSNAYKDNDGSLVVLNVNPKDATYFICHATNRYGTDQATVTLKVKVPPEVTVTPHQKEVVPGVTNIAIECKATGDPPLTVSWAKDGKPLKSNGHLFILPGNVLLVNQATAADYGTYTCTASNAHGSAQATAYAYAEQGTVTCGTVVNKCKQTTCGATCPANCDKDQTAIYGIIEYQMDSVICKAAIQAGAIKSTGGHVIWFTATNVTSFMAGTRNGVVSYAKPVGTGSNAAVFVV